MVEAADYGGLQNPKPAYANAGSGAKAPSAAKGAPAKPAPPPEVEFVFYVLSSALKTNTKELITSLMSYVQVIWRPNPEKDNYESTKKFEVVSKWNGTFTTVQDKGDVYKRIEFPKNAASVKALDLVKANFSNANFDAIVPVFICFAAWDEENEPGSPRDGQLRGFTLVKTLPWFTGERAILLFSSVVSNQTLAHELSHWCGFTHSNFRDDPGNVGSIGGGGVDIDREQLRKYYRWAKEAGVRKSLAGK